jgi:hypothetical protein
VGEEGKERGHLLGTMEVEESLTRETLNEEVVRSMSISRSRSFLLSSSEW